MPKVFLAQSLRPGAHLALALEILQGKGLLAALSEGGEGAALAVSQAPPSTASHEAVERDVKLLQQYCTATDDAVHAVVNEYYEGFNKSIKSYSQFLTVVARSQEAVQHLQQELTQAKDTLTHSSNQGNGELKKLWCSCLIYSYMDSTLAKIKWLDEAGRWIDRFVGSRHFLHAAVLLRRAADTLHELAPMKINALVDIQLLLVHQKQKLADIVVKKIQDQIYLRHTNTAQPSTNQPQLGDTPFSFQYEGLDADMKVVVLEDLQSDPEADSERFLQNCANALAYLQISTTAVFEMHKRVKAEATKLLESRGAISATSRMMQQQFPGSPTDTSRVHAPADVASSVGAAMDACVAALRRYAHFSRECKALDPSSPCSLAVMWAGVQEAILEVLQPLLEEAVSDYSSARTAFTSSAEAGKPKLFAFSNSAAYKYEEMERRRQRAAAAAASGGRGGDVAVVTSLYPHVVRVLKRVQELFDEYKALPPKAVVRLYLHSFMQQQFLPYLRQYFFKRAAPFLEGNDGFTPCERNASSSSFRSREKPLFQCVLQLKAVLGEYADMKKIFPEYKDLFTGIFADIMKKFCDKCETQYNNAIGTASETLVWSILHDPIATTEIFGDVLGQIAKDPKFWTLSQREPMVAQSAGALYECETLLWSFIHDDTFSVPRTKLIFDVTKLEMLANLATSLEWLCDYLSNGFEEADSTASVAKTAPSRFSTATRRRRLAAAAQPTSPQEAQARAGSASVFIDQLRNTVSLSLLALRIECRLHCFHFVLNFKSASYAGEGQQLRPDAFLIELNKDLVRLVDSLARYLTNAQLTFIFDGVTPLLCRLLTRSVSVFSGRVSAAGARRLLRGVFALQHNFPPALSFQKEGWFDAVRKYFEMFLLDDVTELMDYLTEQLRPTGESIATTTSGRSPYDSPSLSPLPDPQQQPLLLLALTDFQLLLEKAAWAATVPSPPSVLQQIQLLLQTK
eukprot:TRINITY_DN3779_c0_g1_i1.p1 TRINITY_DN3779_c0_g1~~TRINITY_DN3779_c0_g1_i1.p1  ORF type:complete len:1012 (-),score=241.18 TRINITY_DN3779_c0_g1_i1:1145-4045(-)